MSSMRGFTALVVAAALMSCAVAPGAEQQEPSAMPAWWIEHVDFMSRDGGTWVTPNPAGENDPAVADAYGMVWRAVNDGHGLVGRLYGIEAGVEIEEYWTYREFWHPGEGRALLQQWGGPGTYGVGETSTSGENLGQVDQTFWLPDGRSWREGHRTVEDGDIYITDTFDIGTDGQWTPSGSSTWRRAANPAE